MPGRGHFDFMFGVKLVAGVARPPVIFTASSLTLKNDDGRLDGFGSDAEIDMDPCSS